MSEVIHFQNRSIFSGLTGRIDFENCVVHGVSLITSNLTAEGHNLFIDAASLKEFHDLGTAAGQIPVNLDHGSGIVSMNGWVDGFRLDQGKWRGDWHMLKSHQETPIMLERCERQPGTFGLSLAFKGPTEGVMRNGKKCAHAEKLLSADCVTRPAANIGMFSAKDGPETVTLASLHASILKLATPQQVDTRKNSNRTFMANENEPTLSDIMAAVSKLGDRVTAAETLNQQIVGHLNSQSEANNEPTMQEQFDLLSQLNAADDAELARVGLTREDVDSAVAEFNQTLGATGEEGDGEGEVEGAGAAEGSLASAAAGNGAGEGAAAGAGAAAGGQAFRALHRELIQLKARVNARDNAERVQAEAIELSEVDGKINLLHTQRNQAVELAERLVAENEALHLAVRTGTRPVKAGVDNGVRLFSANAKGELHPFQQRVKALQAEKKCTEGAAIQFAIKEENGGALHADWLQSQTIHA